MSAREEFEKLCIKHGIGDYTLSPCTTAFAFKIYKAGLEGAASKMRAAGFPDFADELLKEG